MASQSCKMVARCNSDLLEQKFLKHYATVTNQLRSRLVNISCFLLFKMIDLNFTPQMARSSRVSFLYAAVPVRVRHVKMRKSQACQVCVKILFYLICSSLLMSASLNKTVNRSKVRCPRPFISNFPYVFGIASIYYFTLVLSK